MITGEVRTFLFQVEDHFKILLRKLVHLPYWFAFYRLCQKSFLMKSLLDINPKFGAKLFRPYIALKFPLNFRIDLLKSNYTFWENKGLSNLVLNSNENPIEILSFKGKSNTNYKLFFTSHVEHSREGEHSISLFQEQERLYTISFSIFQTDSSEDPNQSSTLIQKKFGLLVGAIQGASSPNRLQLIRKATKDFFSHRPRDFTIQILQNLACVLEIEEVFFVGNSQRVCSNYRKQNKKVHADYDQIWTEFGASKSQLPRLKKFHDGFFCIQSGQFDNDLESVPSHKRSERRKRNDLHSTIRSLMTDRLEKVQYNDSVTSTRLPA